MGGGHVSRPDFGMPQPDPAHPLTEFYCLLQRALDREGVFALPALYAQFRAPARRIYADEAADFLTLLPDEEEGASRLLAPAQLQLLYSSLHVMPDGAPAALLLTEECTRTVYAVQLLPPFVWEDPLPPLPDAPAALSLTHAILSRMLNSAFQYQKNIIFRHTIRSLKKSKYLRIIISRQMATSVLATVLPFEKALLINQQMSQLR